MSIKTTIATELQIAVERYRRARAEYDELCTNGPCPSTLPHELLLLDVGRAVVGEPLVYDMYRTWPSSSPEPLPPKPEKAVLPSEVRWEVWERDNFTCQRCGTRRDLTLDHVLAESKGGTHDADNLQTLCKSCNSRKGPR